LARWQVGLAVLLLLAGFLLVIQVRANRALRAGAALPSRRLDDLMVLVRRQQEADRGLRDEVMTLQAKLDEYRAAASRGESLTGQMRRDVAGLRAVLGLTRLRGPGLRVILAGSPQRLATPQAQDVAGAANELWAAGAEAVAVNGLRVLATEGMVPDRRGIRIRDRVLFEPYVIVAIGDPVALEGALLVRGGLVDGLEGVGITVTLSRLPDVTLGPYTGTLRLRHARPTAPP